MKDNNLGICYILKDAEEGFVALQTIARYTQHVKG